MSFDLRACVRCLAFGQVTLTRLYLPCVFSYVPGCRVDVPFCPPCWEAVPGLPLNHLLCLPCLELGAVSLASARLRCSCNPLQVVFTPLCRLHMPVGLFGRMSTHAIDEASVEEWLGPGGRAPGPWILLSH